MYVASIRHCEKRALLWRVKAGTVHQRETVPHDLHIEVPVERGLTRTIS